MPLWLEVLIKSVILLFVVVTSFAYAMLLERKLLGWMQLRPGQNRVGPWGLLQPAADAAKLILKEDLTPETADPLLYKLAPFISLLTAFGVYAIIPFGASASGQTGAIGNVNAGILLILAIGSLGVYGICLGGWASGSKYPLLGSVRSTAQMISYELAMSLSFVGVLVLAGTTSLDGIVNAQARWWFVLPQFVGCIIYVITPGAAVFFIKVAFFIFFYMCLRATLPRLRYDRLMAFGWKVLLPLATLNLVVTAVVVAYTG